jgi:hypothetical protein
MQAPITVAQPRAGVNDAKDHLLALSAPHALFIELRVGVLSDNCLRCTLPPWNHRPWFTRSPDRQASRLTSSSVQAPCHNSPDNWTSSASRHKPRLAHLGIDMFGKLVGRVHIWQATLVSTEPVSRPFSLRPDHHITKSAYLDHHG